MYAKHVSSASQALYNVFVLPTLPKAIIQPTTLRSTVPKRHAQPLLRRCFRQSTISLAKTRAAEERANKWNEEITARMIQLVDGDTGRLLDDGQPRTKWDVLNSLDLKTHRLVQLVPDEPQNLDFIPVCKIVSKKESYESEIRRKKAAKEQKRAQKLGSEMGAKTLELNWAIDQNNDLMHRLDKMTAFLQEGRRVEITLASKKGGRKATRDECEQVLDKIRAAADGVNGVREAQEFKGRLGGFGTMAFHGRPIAVKQEKQQEKQEDGQESEKGKEES